MMMQIGESTSRKAEALFRVLVFGLTVSLSLGASSKLPAFADAVA